TSPPATYTLSLHDALPISGFPLGRGNHHWIEEGIATYVEPIARIRAGYLAPRRMWVDLVRDMPQGLPQKGDRGLDRTHTWEERRSEEHTSELQSLAYLVCR